jgi:hypothetical protein
MASTGYRITARLMAVGLVFGYAGASRNETRECLKVVRRAIIDKAKWRVLSRQFWADCALRFS